MTNLLFSIILSQKACTVLLLPFSLLWLLFFFCSSFSTPEKTAFCLFAICFSRYGNNAITAEQQLGYGGLQETRPFNEVLIFKRTPQGMSTEKALKNGRLSADQTFIRNQLHLYSLIVTNTTICHYCYYYHGLFCTHLNLGNEDQLINWILCILRQSTIKHVVLGQYLFCTFLEDKRKK